MKKNIIFLFIHVMSITVFSQVGINTNTPKATLDVVASPLVTSKIDGLIAPRLKGSELKSKGTLYTAEQDATIVYVTEALQLTDRDDKTKNIGSIGYYYFDKTLGNSGQWRKFEIEKPVTFFKSGNNQYVADILNNNPGTNVTATFSNANALINQATTFDPITSYFTLLENGLYEFTGTICFNPGRFTLNEPEGHGSLASGERVIINVNIQFSTDGGNNWTGITGMRMIFNATNGDLNIPISTPVALRSLNAGTLVRLSLNRPNISPGSQVAGTNFTTSAPTTYNNINMPTGLDYTKLIKIQKIQ